MANKMLGKVVAGAALGGASLLVFTPGIAFADGHHGDEGKVFAKPHVVKPGHEVKLLQVCEKPQEHAYVWSKVTGKVKLKPVKDERGDWREDGEHGKDKGRDHKNDWKDDKGHGKDDWKDDEGGKDDHKPRPEPTETVTTQPAPPPNGEQPYGQGGGAADAADHDKDRKEWKGYEHGQDAEGGRDSKDYGDESGYGDSKDHEEYGSDERDWKGHQDEESEGHDGYGSDERDWKGHEDEESGEHGKDRWEHKRDFVYYGEAEVDRHAKPGTYELKGSCGEGKLVVLPRGGVDGGDGGVSTGVDRGLATGGAGLLGAAALGGLVLLRRRTDGSLV